MNTVDPNYQRQHEQVALATQQELAAITRFVYRRLRNLIAILAACGLVCIGLLFVAAPHRHTLSLAVLVLLGLGTSYLWTFGTIKMMERRYGRKNLMGNLFALKRFE